MQDIIIATKNNHKITELELLLADYIKGKYRLRSLADVGFDGEIDENADTFEGNAIIKASAVAAKYHCTAFADDSGLVVDALDGEPGVRSARYAGYHAADSTNLELLLKNMADIPDINRTARFVSALAAVEPDGKITVAIGKCEGIILTEKRGSGTFGYDPVFYYPPLGKTFAELDEREKNMISHRGNAVREFALKFFEKD